MIHYFYYCYFSCLIAVYLFLHSFVLLRSVITETHLGTRILARLRSQNALDQNGFSYVKKVMPGSLSLWTPFPDSLSQGPPIISTQSTTLVEDVVHVCTGFCFDEIKMCQPMVILQSTKENSSQVRPSSPSSLRHCQSQCDFPDGDFREEVGRSGTRG